MANFLATGNLVSPSGLDLQQASGFTIVAEKLNWQRYISHFRSIHRGAFFAELKTTTVRKLLPEAWGMRLFSRLVTSAKRCCRFPLPRPHSRWFPLRPLEPPLPNLPHCHFTPLCGPHPRPPHCTRYDAGLCPVRGRPTKPMRPARWQTHRLGLSESPRRPCPKSPDMEDRRQAQRAIACLVKRRDKRDIEAGDLVAKADVDIR